MTSKTKFIKHENNIPLTIAFLFLSIVSAHSQTYVSGTITGETWSKSKSPYIVNGDIVVASLTVEPGVKITFTDNYKFEIAGKISAVGTEPEPVIFTSDSVNVSWNGILFQNTMPGSELTWCIIEYANNSGIRIIESCPVINNCIIRNNTTVNSGAGLYISLTSQCEMEITYCKIENNNNSTNYTISASHGGGIYVSATGDAVVRFSNCSITDNYAFRGDGHVAGGGGWISGNIEFSGCLIKDNVVTGSESIPGGNSAGRGGGLYIGDGNITIRNTIISNNLSRGYASGGMSGNAGYASGGGMHINNGAINIFNSIISHNSTSGTHGTNGGGIFANDGLTYIENSTFAFNNIHAIENSNAELSVINSILYFNNNDGEQVKDSVVIVYSDVQNGFEGMGNINYNPVFYNDTTLIIVDGSPCIDMGNPDSTFNDVNFPPSLGGERNDMGAHGGPGAVGWMITNDETDILNYSFGIHPQIENTIINFNAHTINIEVENGTDVNGLIATFELSDGATATVNDISQESKVTANDFSNPLTYRVVAEDRLTKQDWVVTVSLASGTGENMKNDLKVFPNPFSNYIFIDFTIPGHSVWNANIYNLSGIKVYELDDIKSGMVELKTDHLPAGSYILEFHAGENSLRKLLIKR